MIIFIVLFRTNRVENKSAYSHERADSTNMRKTVYQPCTGVSSYTVKGI